MLVSARTHAILDENDDEDDDCDDGGGDDDGGFAQIFTNPHGC